MEEKRSFEATDTEIELIEAIRNYNASYPNGAIPLLDYVHEVLAQLLKA